MPDDWGPWLALVGLGAFHGVNPAMGWLFAVALGYQRQSRRTVWLAPLPIAFGHAASVLVVIAAVLLLGIVVDPTWLGRVLGFVLVLWAVWHWRYGHRHRVRVGMTTGMAGLALWSFLMATAHGAGLMLVPIVLPLCLTNSPAADLTATGSVAISLAALAVHSLAMLTVTAAIAVVVYDWLGLAFLRRSWVNLDALWIGALGVTGIVLMAR